MDRRMFSALLIGAAAMGAGAPRAARAEGARLQGKVVFREPVSLPAHAVLDLQLLDVGRADAKAEVLAHYQAPVGSRNPIAFSMPVELWRWRPGQTPALRASILIGGRLSYTSTERISLPADLKTPVTILVQRVSGGGAVQTPQSPSRPAPEPGPQGRWLIEDILGRGVLDGPPARLIIAADGAVSGTGGCNRMSGKAQIRGDRIRFGPMISTEMACPPAAMAQDAGLAKALERARRFRLLPQQQKLLILDGAGKLVLRMSQDG